MLRRWVVRGIAGFAVAFLAVIILATVLVWAQAQRVPGARPDYVALGSSFAAGAGLGRLEQDSPLLCARSVGGYPQQLARRNGLSIVDMSCGGAIARHLLHGGQYFQGPQIRAITRETRLVTITIGGNDVGYVGDLSMLAARKDRNLFGWLVRRTWKGPEGPADRDYVRLERELRATLSAIHARAPDAVVILATYPTLLPPSGTCSRIGLTVSEVDLMRQVGDRLAATTRAAAAAGGAILVDMHGLGAAHHACAPEPWVNGWVDAGPAPFHPTLRGAEATAAAISDALDRQARPSPPPSAP